MTRSLELVVDEPLPGAQGSREHWRLTVVVEEVTPPLMVLTTVTVHVMPVVAPIGPGPWLLHWEMLSGAAVAGLDRVSAAREKPPVSSRSPASAVRQTWVRPRGRAVAVGVVVIGLAVR